MRKFFSPVALSAALLLGLPKAFATEASFTAVEPGRPPASIVVENAAIEEEWNAYREALEKLRRFTPNPLVGAINFLQEGLQKMTGREVPIQFGGELSKGIVLVTLDKAPEEIQKDDEVIRALRNTGEDSYNANEAYFVRSEPDRVLIVANTDEGLSHGVVALLGSVGYEVLGMGPNWIHVPDYHDKPLVFSIQEADRPGFYVRLLWPTSGQDRGIGTLTRLEFSDPVDETVQESYQRWAIGTHLAGTSMPRIRGGHALGRYQKDVVAEIREKGVTEGFLSKDVQLGTDAERLRTTPERKGAIWINSDSDEAPGLETAFVWNGKEWEQRDLRRGTLSVSLDVSSPLVRDVILKAMIERAEKSFSENPDEVFQFQTDPEDGSTQFARLAKLAHEPNWYPDYLDRENKPFGKYALHGFRDLDQPEEIWDPNSPSDHVYGFNNWLLWEFDKYIDSLPEDQQVTKSGKSKKDLVRTNLLSYNYHDVPPNFNLDPRIRIKIAGFPKYRGKGKWTNFRTAGDMAQAYRIMLPKEPAVNYDIWSQAYFHDVQAGNISGSQSAEQIHRKIKDEYDSGFRGFETEIDFNFGKNGLRYYLAAQMLWNPDLTVEELDTLRDQWLQRAFGSAWPEMKEYYDFMVPQSSGVNSPHTWSKAIRLLDAAGRKVEGTNEEAAQRRIDDVKQFWYFYYLVESGQATADSEALKEFLWKGQMSYMTAMNMVIKRFFDEILVEKVLDVENMGAAHYTHEETQQWWEKVLDFWPLKEVTEFADSTLADGTKGSEVDVNDLVLVQEFANNTLEADNTLHYNRLPGKLLHRQPVRFFTTPNGNGEIGFKLLWPHTTRDGRRTNAAVEVPYGISKWNPETVEWEEVVDFTLTSVVPETVETPDGRPWYLAEVRFPTTEKGTYRVEVGPSGSESILTSLDYDLQNGTAVGANGFTYFSPVRGAATASRRWYVYIPKGTRSLDLETSGVSSTRLELYRGFSVLDGESPRRLDIKEWGLHRIELEEGEDGSIAVIDGFAFPYLYSVPMLGAKTPSALLVPRAVVKADGLTATEPSP